jgi:predicted GNAT family acetyltransferase
MSKFPASPEVIDNAAAHRFEITVNGQLAITTYRIQGGHMILPHTEVPDALQGQGIAGKLVKAALESARQQGLKVIPSCSYVAAYMKRHPEYDDLLR